MFAKTVVREWRIPFNLSAMSEEERCVRRWEQATIRGIAEEDGRFEEGCTYAGGIQRAARAAEGGRIGGILFLENSGVALLGYVAGVSPSEGVASLGVGESV